MLRRQPLRVSEKVRDVIFGECKVATETINRGEDRVQKGEDMEQWGSEGGVYIYGIANSMNYIGLRP